MVYDGIILSLIVGFIRGGSLKGLQRLNFKYGWVFPILLLFQVIIFYVQNDYAWIAKWSGFSFMLVYIVGLLFLWMNRSHAGMKLIVVGVLLNFIVMAVNGGRMPVSLEAAAVLDPSYVQALQQGLYAKHTMLIDSTKLAFLGDIIPLTNPYPRTQVISIGDILMNIGIFMFIQHVMSVGKTNKESLQPAQDI
jgi:hypothetical protein